MKPDFSISRGGTLQGVGHPGGRHVLGPLGRGFHEVDLAVLRYPEGGVWRTWRMPWGTARSEESGLGFFSHLAPQGLLKSRGGRHQEMTIDGGQEQEPTGHDCPGSEPGPAA